MSHEAAEKTYLVAGSRPWNKAVFDRYLATLPGRWFFISESAELTAELLAELQPSYIFFVHWSWKVPAFIIQQYECVCFHMTDVPYGRGGSPLQNLIVRGHTHTRLSALRMTDELDAGPVYAQRELCLAGAAEEIYLRAAELGAEIIRDMVGTEPDAVEQNGTPVFFKRRTPAESALPPAVSLQETHNFIRMLDAEGYPKAFIEAGGLRFEFSRSALHTDHILADVKIIKIQHEGDAT